MAIEKVGAGFRVVTKADLSRVRIFHLFGSSTEIRFDIKKLSKSIKKLKELLNKEEKDVPKGKETITKDEIEQILTLLRESSQKWEEIENDKENIEFKEGLHIKDLVGTMVDMIKDLSNYNLTDGQKDTLRELYEKFENILKTYTQNVIETQKEQDRIFELGRETLRQKFEQNLNITLMRREVRKEIKHVNKNVNSEKSINHSIHSDEKKLSHKMDNNEFEKIISNINSELKKLIESFKEDAQYLSQESMYFMVFLYHLKTIIEEESKFIDKIETLGFNIKLSEEFKKELEIIFNSLKKFTNGLFAKDEYLEKNLVDSISLLEKEEHEIKSLKSAA